MGSNPKSQHPKRQPVSSRLPLSRRRIKRLVLPLDIVITLRRFKTNPARRSKRYKQIVIQIPVLAYKEIALAKSPPRSFKHHPKTKPKDTLLWLPRWSAIGLILLIVLVNGAALLSLNWHKANKVEATATQTAGFAHPSTAPKVLPHAQPTQLHIPSINLDTELIQTGSQANGSIQMPERYDVAAWYSGSPTPGELGPSIIVGHVDNYKGVAVFWQLSKLQAGDRLTIDRTDGSAATFKVRQVKEFPQNNFPSQQVYGKINYAGLRLITCGGLFNPQTGAYNDNIVVYANLE